MEKYNLKNKILAVIAAIPMLMSLTACNGNNQSAATTTAATAYTLSGGICYITGTATVVSTTYCGTSSTTGYTYSGGVCYITGTSTVVSTTYCTSTTSGYTYSGSVCYVTGTTTVVANTYCGISTTTTGTTVGNCTGQTMYDPRVGQWGICTAALCHGVYLYTTSYQLVYCQ